MRESKKVVKLEAKEARTREKMLRRAVVRAVEERV